LQASNISSIQTQWIVFTGAPCSGKTTILQELEKRGFKCQEEVPRAYIKSLLDLGLNLDAIRSDEGQFQRDLLTQKILVESTLDPNEAIIMDRAIPDSISYYRQAGVNPQEVCEQARFKYKQVFHFARLKLVHDSERNEDEETVERLDYLLREDYRALGYELIEVPRATVEERVSFVLEHLNCPFPSDVAITHKENELVELKCV